MGKKWLVNLACNSKLPHKYRALLRAANLRHGTDGFTSLPKEGMLWIFLLWGAPTSYSVGTMAVFIGKGATV
jgi:hypothetical protein